MMVVGNVESWGYACRHETVKKRGDTAAACCAEGVPKATPQCPRIFSQTSSEFFADVRGCFHRCRRMFLRTSPGFWGRSRIFSTDALLGGGQGGGIGLHAGLAEGVAQQDEE